MNFLRMICAVVLAFPAGLFLLLAITAFSGKTVKDTIEHSRQISVSFNAASEFVEDYRQQNNRLPDVTEFAAWASKYPQHRFLPSGIQFVVGPFPRMIEEEYGPAPAQGYMFTYWRGEWDEIYVSWTRQSSLEFDESKYFLLGHRLAESAIMFSIFGALVVIIIKLWPSRQKGT